MNPTVSRILHIITLTSIVVAGLLWMVTVIGWIVTEPGFEPVNALVGAILSSLIALFGWLRETKQLVVQPVSSVSLKSLSSELGKGGEVKWVRRFNVAELLLQEQRILITGEEGIGKTREGVEMIRHLTRSDNNIVHPKHIYEPAGTVLQVLNPIQVEDLLRQSIATHKPLVLFIDNLPQQVPKTSLDVLATCLEVLDEHDKAFIIATAHDSQLAPAHHNWLKDEGFKTIHLAPFDKPHLQEFLDNAAHEYGVELSSEAADVFVVKSNGNPEIILTALHDLQGKPITPEQVETTIESSLAQVWVGKRKRLLRRYPPARYLIDALSVFSTAGLENYTPFVISFAASLWERQSRRWLPTWIRILVLKRVLQRLADSKIVVRGHKVTFSGNMIEPEFATPEYVERLGDFLLEYRRLYRLPIIGLVYRHAILHAYSLSIIGHLYASERDNHEKAIRFYDNALQLTSNKKLASQIYTWRWSPKFGIDSTLDSAKVLDLFHQAILAVRTLTLFQSGSPYEFITAFTKVFDSDSNLPLDKPVTSGLRILKASAHEELGEIDQAIKDYSKAITLDPKNFLAYFFRASAYIQNDSQQALSDIESALRLKPDFDDALMLQTILLIEEERYESALSSITQLFALKASSYWFESDRPQLVYIIRVGIYYYLDEFDKAIDDLTSAIKLEQRAEWFFLRASLHARRLNHDDAVSDFKMAASITDDKHLAQLCDFSVRNINFLMLGEFRELAKEYLKRGMYNWSRTDFDRAAAQNPDDPVVYYGWSLLHLRDEKPKLSMEYVNRAIKLAPNSHELFHMRVFLTLMIGSPIKWSNYDWDAALAVSPNKAMEYVIALSKANPDILDSYELSLLHTTLITTMEAFKNWDMAIALSPNEMVASYYSELKQEIQATFEEFVGSGIGAGLSMLGIDQVSNLSNLIDEIQQRLCYLLSLKETGMLSETEQLELEELQQSEYILTMFKTQIENRRQS